MPPIPPSIHATAAAGCRAGREFRGDGRAAAAGIVRFRETHGRTFTPPDEAQPALRPTAPLRANEMARPRWRVRRDRILLPHGSLTVLRLARLPWPAEGRLFASCAL